MLKFKTFTLESTVIEYIINQWLNDNPEIKILNLSQESIGDCLRISFCYREKDQK